MIKLWRYFFNKYDVGWKGNGMETFLKVTKYAGKMAKAVVAGPYSGAMYLTGIWTEAESFSDAFGGMTPNQWILFGMAVLGGWGVTYAVRNQHNSKPLV